MLPDSVTHFFLALFLISLAIFVLIPACIGYWRLAHGSLAASRQGFMRLHDLPIMIVALVLTNAFYYIVGNGSAHPMPHDTLRALLALLDLLFLLFWLDTIIVSLITRRAKRAATTEKLSRVQLSTNMAETLLPMNNPASNPENTAISPTDEVQTDEN